MASIARIFKYDLEATQRQLLHLPRGARPLRVGTQGDLLKLWCLLPDPDAVPEPRIFRVVTTGEVFNDAGLTFIGSFTAGGSEANSGTDWFVGFVFEQQPGEPDSLEARFQGDYADVRRQQRDIELARIAGAVPYA